jgi:hypothetical protein
LRRGARLRRAYAYFLLRRISSTEGCVVSIGSLDVDADVGGFRHCARRGARPGGGAFSFNGETETRRATTSLPASSQSRNKTSFSSFSSSIRGLRLFPSGGREDRGSRRKERAREFCAMDVPSLVPLRPLLSCSLTESSSSVVSRLVRSTTPRSRERASTGDDMPKLWRPAKIGAERHLPAEFMRDEGGPTPKPIPLRMR